MSDDNKLHDNTTAGSGNDRASGRRRLIKALAAGGGVTIAGKGVADQWVKPVISSVVLPAHAQTTVVPEVKQRARVEIQQLADRFSPMDFFIQEAAAQPVFCDIPPFCFDRPDPDGPVELIVDGVSQGNVSSGDNVFVNLNDCYDIEIYIEVIGNKHVKGTVRCRNDGCSKKDETEIPFDEPFQDGSC